jgi:hypothetical protein
MALTFEQLIQQIKDDQEKAVLQKVFKENEAALKDLEAAATYREQMETWRQNDKSGFPVYEHAYQEYLKLKPEFEATQKKAEALAAELEALKSAKPPEGQEGAPQPIDIEKLGQAIMAKMKASGEIVTKAEALALAQQKADEARQSLIQRGFPEMKGLIEAGIRYKEDFGKKLDEQAFQQAVLKHGSVDAAYRAFTEPEYKAKEDARIKAEIDKAKAEAFEQGVAKGRTEAGNAFVPQDQVGAANFFRSDSVGPAEPPTPLDKIPKDIDITKQGDVLARAVAAKWREDQAAGKVLQ